MISFIRILVLGLAVLAVGAAQIFGVKGGYLCGCTGEQSVEEVCRKDACHPSSPHQDGCGAVVEAPGCGDHGKAPMKPVPHEHKHNEVRKVLIGNAGPLVLALPAVMFFELRAAFQTPFCLTAVPPLRGLDRPPPREDGSPPIPLLVARTVVMLV